MHGTSSISTVARRLVEHIRGFQSVVVAFSGGVDSAVVARAACLALGSNAVAVTAVSPSLASAELQLATDLAATIGIRHICIPTTEFERPEYRSNQGNRCYFCKDTLYSMIAARLASLNASCILNGTNKDDMKDYRPGMRAADLHHVRSPLIDMGLAKADVRELARFWNLSVADKPASPCLASRIAYGVEVTPERVARIEQAEALLRKATGIDQLRVRCEAADLARIEVPLEALQMLTEPGIRAAVSRQLRSIGFRRVTLDLEGFRSGSLNDALPVVQLKQPTTGISSD